MATPVKVYGPPLSTAVSRVLVTLLEKDVPFQLVPVNMAKGEHKKPDYIKMQVTSINSTNSTNQSEELYLANSKFESYDDLLKSVRAFYYNKGYGLSIRDSRKDKHVTLQCDRGGVYKDIRGIKDKREKNTGSRLTNCQFQIVGKKGNDGAWMFKVKNLAHNHEPSLDMSGHPSFRQLSPSKIKIVKEMTKSGIQPRQILSSLRQQTPNIPAISRTIYNLKKKIRRDELGNRSMINALFEELEKDGFVYDILHNQEGHITRLFIAHPSSIKLAKIFSNMFMMDCTYKTNKYNMPFLDIIGVSCFNTTFYSGFAFLEKEDEENYSWALSAFKEILGQGNQPSVIMTDRELALMNGIKKVFLGTTNLLCVWHIEKNVLANCKKHFDRGEEFNMFMSGWNNVAYSTTEDLFEKNWGEFELFYKEKKDVIGYIKRTWLPWKEKFVSAWTDKYLHLGNRSSARVEGAHSKLKKYLQVSTGGFQEVKDKISLVVEHEFNEIKVKLASERIQVLHDCNIPFFRELLSNISHFALKEIHKQYEKINDGTMTPCTGHFTATMGIPCVHKIKYWQGRTLSLDIIHPQWRIDTFSLNTEDKSHNDDVDTFVNLVDDLKSKYEVWPLNKRKFATSMITKLLNQSDTFFEPTIQRPKGRPQKSKKKRGITSTTRDPSRFEYVESSQTHNEVVKETQYMHHENNLFDLNAYPGEFMSFE